ncbi:hypothetical protein ECC02_005146 [Trypanosoma cruzi]|uniref:Uncharacterized protein n=1 Tax=Trypanosoma cruzi TaxID=5693 RepID=A0A7J6Y6A2_TRYCR|nr:hypothetical protein ECC02_005146 [Trypanosoma cruzi]
MAWLEVVTSVLPATSIWELEPKSPLNSKSPESKIEETTLTCTRTPLPLIDRPMRTHCSSVMLSVCCGASKLHRSSTIAAVKVTLTKHTHTPSQCCQSAGERIRSSTQQTHTPPAFNHNGREKETHRLRLQLNPAANRIRPRPCRQHATLTEPAIAQRATRAGGSLSIHDAAPHSVRSHAVHHVNRKRDSRCALSLLLSPHAHGRKRQLHATASTEYKGSIHLHCNVCVLRVWLCAPTATLNKVGKKEREKREEA